jgi:hypothetical protein
MSDDLTEEEWVEDPTDFWDSLWRRSDVTLCEARTVLSGEEHDYILSRKRRHVPPLVEAKNGATPEAWCPLDDGHSGPHIALIGWGDERNGGAHMGFFLSWGSPDAPRSLDRLQHCDETFEHGGSDWSCRLQLGHEGVHRRSVEWQEGEFIDTRQGALMDDMWRQTADALCDEVTVLSEVEHTYVTTLWRFDPAWLRKGVEVEGFKLWCPLARGHGGAHTAKLGWADEQYVLGGQLFPPGDWFISWGPTDASPRSIGGSNGVCGNEAADASGAQRTCSLMAGHRGACRMNLYAVSDDLDDSDFGEYDDPELTSDEEAAWAEEDDAWFEQRLVDAYLEGDSTYFEIGMDWGMSEGAVSRIVRRLTTPEQRREAQLKRQHFNRVRGEAQYAWLTAQHERIESERRAAAASWLPSAALSKSMLEDLARRLSKFNPSIVENGVVVPIYTTGLMMAALEPRSLTVRHKMDRMEDWESFWTFDFDSPAAATRAVEGAAMMMSETYEDDAPVESGEVEVLNQLARLLSDLNPVVTVQQGDAGLDVAYDSEAKVMVSLFDHQLFLGTDLAIGDWEEHDQLETLGLTEIQRAADWVRATLKEMPQLKEEFAEDCAEREEKERGGSV